MKKGAFVRHRKMSEWGVGKVVSDEGDPYLQIDFEGRSRFKIQAAAAGELIEEIDDQDVPADHPLRAGDRRRAQRKTIESCAHCKKPLNRSMFSPKRTWKSCPRCSVLNGSEHVFHAYPDDFGTSEERASGDTPDGAQSYCTVHRSNVNASVPRSGRQCSGQPE